MTGATATKTIDVSVAGATTLRLVVTDGGDGINSDHGDWALARVECGGGGGGNTPPTPTIASPSSSLTWKVGDAISFSGSATDTQDGNLPASALSWTLAIEHCPSNCHEHIVQTWPGVASGSFNAPDHEYPSYLQLRLTATDSNGVATTTSVDLQPITVNLTFNSSPSGLQFVGGEHDERDAVLEDGDPGLDELDQCALAPDPVRHVLHVRVVVRRRRGHAQHRRQRGRDVHSHVHERRRPGHDPADGHRRGRPRRVRPESRSRPARRRPSPRASTRAR